MMGIQTTGLIQRGQQEQSALGQLLEVHGGLFQFSNNGECFQHLVGAGRDARHPAMPGGLASYRIVPRKC